MQRIHKLPTVKQHHCKQTSVNLNFLTNETTVFVFIVDTRIALFAFEHSHSSDWLRPWCIFGEFLFSIPKLLKSIKSWFKVVHWIELSSYFNWNHPIFTAAFLHQTADAKSFCLYELYRIIVLLMIWQWHRFQFHTSNTGRQYENGKLIFKAEQKKRLNKMG